MADSSKLPFARVALHDAPLLVGAEWWQASMAAVDPVLRRQALLGVAGVLATVAMVGSALVLASDCGDGDVDVKSVDALEAQKTYGWSFGAGDATLAFEGASSDVVDAQTLDRISVALMPKAADYLPYYVPTLFQALAAPPTALAPGANPSDPPPARLRDVLRPIATGGMAAAFAAGDKLRAKLLDMGEPLARAVFVDLPGPESVAFAAALAPAFDTVFTFDNWPHPRGVVPSHLTFAAALHHLDAFVRGPAPPAPSAPSAPSARAPAAFVLDANRLAPYSDESDKFDNRYLARVPPADKLKALGVREVVYVRGRAADAESDDLNATFAGDYARAGITVRRVGADAPDAVGEPVAAAPRATLFTSGAPGSFARPSAFGAVGLLLARGTGQAVGVEPLGRKPSFLGSRSSGSSGSGGSWGRSSGFSGG